MGKIAPYQIIIEVQIHPDSADRHAAAFRAAAGKIMRLSDGFRDGQGRLDQVWEGNARERFFESIEYIPGRLDEFAGILKAHARSIEHRKVAIQRNTWITPD